LGFFSTAMPVENSAISVNNYDGIVPKTILMMTKVVESLRAEAEVMTNIFCTWVGGVLTLI
jgi:hypothetical protein